MLAVKAPVSGNGIGRNVGNRFPLQQRTAREKRVQDGFAVTDIVFRTRAALWSFFQRLALFPIGKPARNDDASGYVGTEYMIIELRDDSSFNVKLRE